MRTAFALFALLVLPVYADTVTFDFEDFDGDNTFTSGAYTITIDALGAAAVGYENLSPFTGQGVPGSWGNVSLSPFNGGAGLFRITLDAAPAGFGIQNATIEFGDFGPGDVDVGFIDGGVFPAYVTLGQGPNPFSWATIDTTSGGNFTKLSVEVGESFFIQGGGWNGFSHTDHTVYWDNLVLSTVMPVEDLPGSVPKDPPIRRPGATQTGTAGQAPAVPEPGTLTLCGLVLAAAWVTLRR